MWFVFISKWLLNSLFIIKSNQSPMPSPSPSHHPTHRCFESKCQFFMVLWQHPKCLFTICLCSLYRQHLFEQNTSITLSLFSYNRVTFTQIFIKGPFLFYSVLSSDIIIIGLVESLNTWVQKKEATKEGSHYKNASLWCQNIGENGQAPGTASENI